MRTEYFEYGTSVTRRIGSTDGRSAYNSPLFVMVPSISSVNWGTGFSLMPGEIYPTVLAVSYGP